MSPRAEGGSDGRESLTWLKLEADCSLEFGSWRRERGQAGKGTRASAQSWKPEPEKASKDHVCAWQSMTGPERPFPAGPASWGQTGLRQAHGLQPVQRRLL